MSVDLRSTTRKARSALRRLLFPELQASSFRVDKPTEWGFVDCVKVDPAGIISVQGWARTSFDAQAAPSVLLDAKVVPFLRFFRTPRPDVGTDSAGSLAQTGLELNYLVPEPMLGQNYTVLTLQLPASEFVNFELNSKFLYPDYRPLLHSPEVFHRDHIYGSGPPNTAVHPQVVELARKLNGPVLDFGCGRGALLGELLKGGLEAYGLELDSDIIRQSIPNERSHLISLYGGSFPSPFSDARFRSVVCSEVLEHIPDYQAAIKDIVRLASEKVLFTVPDSSAIPLGFRHGCVPWHLLEATHVNFFNQESLGHALKPYFSEIEFGRIGLSRFNDSPYYVSLAALCRK